MEYEIREERLTAGEYIDFLKRRGLGSQYPKGRFAQRIETLMKSVPISLTARGEGHALIGCALGLRILPTGCF